MYEVEVKVRADHEPVRARLGDQGATATGTVAQEDTYYDAPHRAFVETDEALRVRRETDGPETAVTLTYKGPKVDSESKSRREVETVVADGEATDSLLRALGFEPAATVHKERERYRLAGYAVVLDTVEGLGQFVEVETEAEAVDPAREGALDVLADLGLDPADQIRRSYLGMLLGNARE